MKPLGRIVTEILLYIQKKWQSTAILRRIGLRIYRVHQKLGVSLWDNLIFFLKIKKKAISKGEQFE